MSVFVLNPSDTIVLKDTIAVKFVAIVENCQPIVKETGTNWQDVAIALSICIAFAIVVCYGIRLFFTDRKNEREFQKGKESLKHNWEEAEKDRKKTAEKESRTWQHEDQERKQKNSFIDRYLDFLKDQAENETDEARKRQYRETLAFIIEASQKGELNKITDNKLNSVFKQNCDEEESKQKPMAQI